MLSRRSVKLQFLLVGVDYDSFPTDHCRKRRHSIAHHFSNPQTAIQAEIRKHNIFNLKLSCYDARSSELSIFS
jgi:hypothetical protein